MVNTSPQTAEKCKRTRAWERRKEHRPGELLDAALEVFVARGYAAARLDDVAARAGVSKGTLYLYYAGKEDLFKAVVRVNIVPASSSSGSASNRPPAATKSCSPTCSPTGGTASASRISAASSS